MVTADLDLRERTAVLEVSHQNLDNSINRLEAAVATLSSKVDELSSSLDKGRGVLYAVSLFSGGIGAAVASLFHTKAGQ
jgi:4-diphosphocytidyl-2C-methyl-D-erythritol kinase